VLILDPRLSRRYVRGRGPLWRRSRRAVNRAPSPMIRARRIDRSCYFRPGVIFTESSGTAIEPDRAGHERLA
jgi:hypothetical protein